MKAKPVRPLVIAIQKRFFLALDDLIHRKKISGLVSFCDTYGLHKAKYSELRALAYDPAKNTKFKFIDIDAPAILVKDYGVSGDWIFTGKGSMYIKADIKQVKQPSTVC